MHFRHFRTQKKAPQKARRGRSSSRRKRGREEPGQSPEISRRFYWSASESANCIDCRVIAAICVSVAAAANVSVRCNCICNCSGCCNYICIYYFICNNHCSLNFECTRICICICMCSYGYSTLSLSISALLSDELASFTLSIFRFCLLASC